MNSIEDSRAQLRAISLYKGDPPRLLESLTSLSISLVMGLEIYVRNFQSSEAIPLLISVADKYMSDNSSGDIAVMTFRALSLILELVPSSYDAALDHHKSIMKLVSTAMHKGLCFEWRYQESDTPMLLEECLRVIRFVGKDDPTGTIMRYAFVGDLLTLCTFDDGVLVRKALETLLMLCSKVVMPSELDKPVSQAGFLSIFKSKKKKAVDTSIPNSDNPIVVNVENVIAPFLLSLIEQHTASLSAVPEVWAFLELCLQCLGNLMERSLLCHRPNTAQTLVSRELPCLLFRLINLIEGYVAVDPATRAERVLLCETLLAVIPMCRREFLADSLLNPEAKKFFHSILGDNTGAEITTLLDEPFPRGVMAARSTMRRDKDHITSIAAIRLFLLACPNVPPDAFGLKPKVVLPVHQWLWEDELRHANRLVEEQCVLLETRYVRLSREAAITVQTKSLAVDLHAMTMARGGAHNCGKRNISRTFVPFVYHFADEHLLRPVVAVKDSGPQPDSSQVSSSSGGADRAGPRSSSNSNTGGGFSIGRSHKCAEGNGSSTSRREKNSSDSHAGPSGAPEGVIINETAVVPEAHTAIAEEYLHMLCGFASHASGQMARQLATCACASILQLLLLSRAQQRVGRLMNHVMLPMCETFRESLISADKATKAVVLTMVQWLLQHKAAANWNFCETALRCGLVNQLDVLSKTTIVVAVKDSRPTRTASLAENAGNLKAAITHKLTVMHPGFAKDPYSITPDILRLKKAVGALDASAALPGSQEKPLLDLMQALSVSGSEVTPFEIFHIDLATTVMRYFMGGSLLDDLFGPAVIFSSSASGTTQGAGAQQLNSRNTPLETHSTWAAMMTGGMRLCDLLHMRTREERTAAFRKCAAKHPQGLRSLVSYLSATLPLESHFPLVQSIVTDDKVACKTPLQAFQALTDISPVVSMCGPLGKTLTELSSPSLALPQQGPSATAMALATSSVPFRSPQLFAQSSQLSSQRTMPLRGALGLSIAGSTAPVSVPMRDRNPREYCLKGHKLREVPVYDRQCICDMCDRPVRSGYCCRTCNFDVCRECYGRYTGNATLFESLVVAAAAPRNRAHLLVCIGDIERYFRTGASTTKGTELAPTSQSSLHHVPRFMAKVKHFLARQAQARGGAGGSNCNSNSSNSSSSISTHRGGVTQSARVNAIVAQKLLDDPKLTYKLLYDILQGFYTRGVLANAPPEDNADDPAADRTLSSLTEGEAAVADRLLREAIEDRYILYRPAAGACPYQESFLSVLYRHAFATGNKQVLLQLENCLLRLEGSTEALTLVLPPSLPASAVSATRRSSGSRIGSPFSSLQRSDRAPEDASPSGCATPSNVSDRRGGGGGGGGGGEADVPRKGSNNNTNSSNSINAEFAGGVIAKEQSFVFHHFESDLSECCACGQHTRREFRTEETPALFFSLPEIARRTDLQLLMLLHRMYVEDGAGSSSGGETRATGALCEGALSRGIFVNTAITASVVKSLEASALRVSVLPPKYALPRWVNFVLDDARFLLPLPVRERIARFLAYGARRSFITHLRFFHQFRYDRSVTVTASEWARLSNHKYSVNRSTFLQDAYIVMRKAADARMPISIEFKGDLGVGQGPTAQFYTLLAKEVSRASLGLWRNVTAVNPDGSPVSDVTKSPTASSSSRCGSASADHTNGAATHHQAEAKTSVAGSTTMHHEVPPSLPVSHSTALSPSALETDALVVAPPEGLFPKRMTADGRRPPSRRFSSGSSTSSRPLQQRVTRRDKVILEDSTIRLLDYGDAQREKAKALYMIGAALGRAFLDEQVLPLEMSSAMSIFMRRGIPPYKLVLDAKDCPDCAALVPIDLLELPLRAVRLVDVNIADSLAALSKMDEATLKSLEVPFTLPGDDSFELIPGGADIFVTKSNLTQYQRRVVSALLYESVSLPIHFMMLGFFDVVPQEAIASLEVTELMSLLCGEAKRASDPLWTVSEIKSVLVGDHGYQNDSPQLSMLASILGKRLNPREQRAFLLFCTGCPRLPIGGICALGAITVVKRSNAFIHVRNMVAAQERLEEEVAGGESGVAGDEDMDPLQPGSMAAGLLLSDPESGSAAAIEATPVRDSSTLSRPGVGDDDFSGGALSEADWALPSVNTCFRYLKLPPYPSEELMYKKLLLSITQSGDTFELS